eukprot:TRINITY_DN287_c0_g3_i1.p1 TRINITY_DN287_c0_g3~~TRINITY_DN287_c0_g3_i1.p1  ORF type:complete len:336 (+),score=82.48 TRINITY_DN287_c0_g3_i1:66-1073(+)
MPLFRTGARSPQDIVKSLRESLSQLEKNRDNPVSRKKTSEEVCKSIVAMKTILYGVADQEPQQEQVALLSQEVYTQHLLFPLIQSLNILEFESRKEVALIFSHILKRQLGTRFPTVDYLVAYPELLTILVRGYETPETALNNGLMLRECLRHEMLTRIVLYSDDLFLFFKYVQLQVFDIASDAFATLRDLLTRHKIMTSEFLEKNYDKVFSHYQSLIESDNYVTRRQSLKLLGELLLDRHNFTVMTRYIASGDNLKVMMNLLCNPSRNIQFEAFHVFKVFVANPNKSQPVGSILLKNRDKLVEFLSRFQTDRSEDEQFNEERAYLIKQIRDMKAV